MNEFAAWAEKYNARKGFGKQGWKQTNRKISIPEALLLIVTECSEAMDAWRDKDFENFSEELADIQIRLLDLAGHLGVDLESEVKKKMVKNFNRPHKHGRVRW